MNAIKLLTLLMLAAFALPMAAQETFDAYTAKVTGDSVRLRSGPSTAHPPVHVLADGDELVVVGEKDGWAMVRLPAAAPCWLSADFVKLEGKAYTVTGDNVNLRISADTKYFPVGQSKKGETLTPVLDAEGKRIEEAGFVKVVPPASAEGAVAMEFITKVSDSVAEPTVKADTEEKTDAKTDAKPEPTPKVETKPEPKREPTKAELEDERKTFSELERMLDDEIRKPAPDVNLTGIRKMFEQFHEFALDKTVSEKAASYIKKIDLTVQVIEAEKARLAKEEADRIAEIERIRKDALEKPKEVETPKGPVEYLWTGTVGSHGKTAKTPASHRLFDADGKIIHDLRWDKGDLAKLMGNNVGIVGKVKKYDGWPHEVIIIERIDILEDGESK